MVKRPTTMNAGITGRWPTYAVLSRLSASAVLLIIASYAGMALLA